MELVHSLPRAEFVFSVVQDLDDILTFLVTAQEVRLSHLVRRQVVRYRFERVEVNEFVGSNFIADGLIHVSLLFQVQGLPVVQAVIIVELRDSSSSRE